MTTHSPGPWIVEAELGQIAGYIHNDQGDDTGRAICDLRPGSRVKHNDKRRTDSFVFNETDLANARLIAAAPDMLRTLELIRDASEGHVPVLNDWINKLCTHVINQAKEATK